MNKVTTEALWRRIAENRGRLNQIKIEQEHLRNSTRLRLRRMEKTYQRLERIVIDDFKEIERREKNE